MAGAFFRLCVMAVRPVMRRMLFCLFTLLLASPAALSAGETLRIGVLQYGTLNWELDAIEQLKLANRYQLTIERVPKGSPQALLVALQGGAVDLIVNDWLWVARQQDEGRQYYFYPYSNAAGVLVTQPQSGIHSLSDLKGKTIGIAGGTANKNWILYRAFVAKQTGLDLAKDADLKFAAPPLLNALMEQGKLDAAVNFWHYAAQLNAKGMTTLATMGDVLQSYGLDADSPVLGWVFSKAFADTNEDIINRFLALSSDARNQLQTNDGLWRSLPSFTQHYSANVQPFLINAYREGIPKRHNADIATQLSALFSVLKTVDNQQAVTGNLAGLSHAIFWQRAHLD